MIYKFFGDIYKYWFACRMPSIAISILVGICVYSVNKNRISHNILITRTVSAGLFGGYLVCFLYITLFMRFVGYRREVDFIPFHFLMNYQVEFVLFMENIVLFIPMGLYMQNIRKRSKYTLCVCAIISVIIELLQFVFGCGKTEIDDVIANTFGAWIGIHINNEVQKKVK